MNFVKFTSFSGKTMADGKTINPDEISNFIHFSSFSSPLRVSSDLNGTKGLSSSILTQNKKRRRKENVTWKLNSLCPELHNSHSFSFNLSSVGEFFWSWFLRPVSKFRKKKIENCCLALTSSIKQEIVKQQQRSVQKRVIKVQNKNKSESSELSLTQLLMLTRILFWKI